MTITENKLTDILMYIIDSFISLQLQAKNLPINKRHNFLVKNYRKILAEEFEHHIKNHPIYLNHIKTKESGPYSPYAFDINHQPNLLNL